MLQNIKISVILIATLYKIFFGISRYFVAAICKNTIYCVFEKLKNTICCGVLKKGETSRTRFTLNFRFWFAPSQAAGIVCVVRRAQRVGAVARERDNNISYGLAKRTNPRRVRNQCLWTCSLLGSRRRRNRAPFRVVTFQSLFHLKI